MDALLAFGINWKLLLIQGVNFTLLMALLYRFLYKPLFALLEKRQGEIAKGLADAEKATKEMERIAGETETIMRSAREEGGKIVDTLRKEASSQERTIVNNAEAKSAAILAEAKAKAEEERAFILRESEKEIAKMAVLATEKILRAEGAKA